MCKSVGADVAGLDVAAEEFGTVQKLSRRARGHDKAQATLRFRRNSAEQRLGQIKRILPAVEEALTRRIDTQGDRFRARVMSSTTIVGMPRKRSTRTSGDSLGPVAV